jgi:hypothetical protein
MKRKKNNMEQTPAGPSQVMPASPAEERIRSGESAAAMRAKALSEA